MHDIEIEGNKAANSIKKLKEENINHEEILETLSFEQFEKDEKIIETDYSSIEKLENEIETMKEKIKNRSNMDTAGHENKISELAKEIEKINKTFAMQEVYENNKKRITELEDQEQKISKEILNIDKNIFGVETYIKTEVQLQENELNSLFRTIRFKLFKDQINGGITECFEALIKGVPYSAANGAAKINCGIEIINKLCEVYQVSAPIWIDDAVTVTKLENTDSQVIRLLVDANVNELTIEEA